MTHLHILPSREHQFVPDPATSAAADAATGCPCCPYGAAVRLPLETAAAAAGYVAAAVAPTLLLIAAAAAVLLSPLRCC